MKRIVIALGVFGFALIFLAVLNAPRKPPLRTWELGTAPRGSDHLSIPLRTPKRDCPPSYRSYNLGLVLPSDRQFDLRGRVIVTSAGKRKTTSIEFDSETVTKSSWLQDQARISYLLRNDFEINDDEDCLLEFHFDEPLETKLGVVLHFLSQTDPKQTNAN